MDTLAVRLTVPLVGPVEDFHLLVSYQAPRLMGGTYAPRALPGAQQKNGTQYHTGAVFTPTRLFENSRINLCLLIYRADCIETAFVFAGAAVHTVFIDLVIIFTRGMDDGIGRTGANAGTTELTLFRIDLMHGFSLK